jgi:hypothetical protein
MTELLPEFASLPVEGVFDAELVAFGDDGLPSFEQAPLPEDPARRHEPGPTVQGGRSFPPPEQLEPNVVSVFLAGGGLLPGEKLRWNARIDGKPAYVAQAQYGRTNSPATCPAGVPSEYRSVNIAAFPGLVGATICGPNLAAGNAAVGRILGSIRLKR